MLQSKPNLKSLSPWQKRYVVALALVKGSRDKTSRRLAQRIYSPYRRADHPAWLVFSELRGAFPREPMKRRMEDRIRQLCSEVVTETDEEKPDL